MGTTPATDPRWLCTPDDVRAVHRTLGDSDAYTALIEKMIKDASTAIRSWSRREFAPAPDEATAREYDLVGLIGTDLSIDDLAEDPSLVERVDGSGTPTALTGVVALPIGRAEASPITALRLAGPNRRRAGTLRVTGRWGFPEVPPDVRRACVDVVDEWLTAAQAGAGAAPEAFEGGATVSRALSPRARWLLEPYIRRPLR